MTNLNAAQLTRLRRFEQLNLIADWRELPATEHTSNRVEIRTTGGDAYSVILPELDVYLSGLAHGSWAVRITESGKLIPPRSEQLDVCAVCGRGVYRDKTEWLHRQTIAGNPHTARVTRRDHGGATPLAAVLLAYVALFVLLTLALWGPGVLLALCALAGILLVSFVVCVFVGRALRVAERREREQRYRS